MKQPKRDQTWDKNQPATAESKPLRVLCAEDNEPLAAMLKYALERTGFAAECVDDGRRALERIKADASYFDLLITDHRMPHLSGLQLIEAVRGTAYRGKIIVHSSLLSDSDLTAYRALAVDHVFSKPVALPEFLRVIRQLIGDGASP